MDDGSPALEVGFLIDTGDSFGELAQLQRVMDSTEAKIVAEARKIESATSGMVKLGGGTAQVTAFGTAATRELANTERAAARAEKAGEALSRSMERQASTFGMTRAAAAALAAEQNGLTELAGRLRAQEAGLVAMREQAAAATRRQADAAKQAAASHADLAAKVRGSQAAQEADAAAAERLRMATDPLYAATSRLNAEIAESTRLYYAGATAPAEYARQQQVLTGRLQETERQFATTGGGLRGVGTSGQLAGHHMTNLAFQFQDLGVQMAMAAQSSAPLKMAFMALLQQGTQISMIMGQAGIGIKGVAAAFLTMSRSVAVAALTNPYLLAFAAAAAAAGLAVRALNKSANEGADLKAYASSIGVSSEEMKKLKGLTVTYGDTVKAVFQVAGAAIWAGIGPAVTAVWDWMKSWTSWIFSGVKSAVNFLIGGFVGAYAAINATWKSFPAALGDIFFSAVNASISAINSLIKSSVNGINGFISQANTILDKAGLGIQPLTAPQIAAVENSYKGAYAKAGAAGKAEMDKALGVDYLGKAGTAISDAVGKQALKNARDRIRKDADEKGFLDPERGKTDKPKTDRRGEALARELESVEALIKGNFALADAYQVSDAAAFKAEIRAKATAAAIKKQADVEAYVAQQTRLAISEAARDAAKAGAALRGQAEAQRDVNNALGSGAITVEAAQGALREEMQIRPLLIAFAAAEGKEKEALGHAIKFLRDQQASANVEAARAKVIADTASNSDQLDRLELEARLINATNKERAVALAQLEVEQYLRANPGVPPDEAKRYRDGKVAVAAMSADLSIARTEADRLLESLTAVAEQASASAEAMSSAFGNVGSVFGGMIDDLARYQVARQQLAIEVKNKTKDQVEADRILGTLQARNTAQAISGVKSLFREHTTAYKIMSGVEKAHAALQLINTIRSIAMDGAKTASSVANSGVRAAADGVAAVAKAIASLPFPLNLAAGAATAAALVAFGVKMFGGGGGGGVAPPTSAEDLQKAAGTGTVLGDSKAKSDSIARSLEIVAANTNRDLEYSNSMLRSLRSIDTGIAKLAGTVAQQIQVSGSMFDTSGQNLGQTGKSAFLGLFGGSSTTRSLYDLGLQLGSASVGGILASGISGSTYQTIEQVKKKGGFLGIGGGTKTSYQTTTGAIDPAITGAITDVVRSLRDGLVGAAGMIGIDGAAAILDSFQVSIGKLSFQGLTGEEIERQLNAVFSSLGDQMAGRLLPSLSSMQLVGEGLFETFTRVAREYQVVDVTLRSMGRAFGAVGLSSVTARDALVQLFGGLEDFVERSEFFREQFLSDAEQIAPVQAAVAAELQRLGAAGLRTRDQFKLAVLGLDLTSVAGREMYASLLALAPAFDKVLDYQEQAQKKTIDGLKQTVDQFGKLAESLRKYRDGLFLADAAQGNGYNALRSRFSTTADLAASGNEKALAELENVGKAFLDSSLNNASTREQYLKDVALVARGVDAGIFAAEETADYAELQLRAAENANTLLTEIAANTAAATAPAANQQATEELRATIVELQAEVAGMRADNNAGLAAVAGESRGTRRILEDVTADSGGVALSTL